MDNTEPHFTLLFLRVGLRVHLVISEAGEPVQCSLAAGSEVDIKVFENLNTDLPEGSTMLADKGYPDRRPFYPDQKQWRALGEAWSVRAETSRLWVTVHDCSEYQLWGGYYASLYVSNGDGKTAPKSPNLPIGAFRGSRNHARVYEGCALYRWRPMRRG